MSSNRLMFGFHAITSRVRQNPASVKEIFLDSSRRDPRARDLVALAENNGVKLISCVSSRLAGMAQGARHQGVAAWIDPAHSYVDVDDVLDTLAEPALLLVLDGIQDPHNLGACLRVADGFGVHAVIAPKDRAVGLTATVFKVASGAADAVPYISVTNLARTLRGLKQRGISIVGAAAEAGNDLNAVELDGPIAWVLGAEGKGMRRLTREICDRLVSIPMLGSVESLNVSVSAGICLFETRRQRSKQRPISLSSRA